MWGVEPLKAVPFVCHVSRFVVSFMMPPKYHSTDDLPKPKNPSLRLREVPAQTRAALSWR